MKVWISSIVLLVSSALMVTLYKTTHQPELLDWSSTVQSFGIALVGWNGFKAMEENKKGKKK